MSTFISNHLMVVFVGAFAVLAIGSSLLKRLFKFKPNAQLSDVAGFIFVGLFLLAFVAIFGGFGIHIALVSLHKGNWAGAWFGAIFIMVGAGPAAAGIIAMTFFLPRQYRLKKADPDKPWMWNPDWASGEITDHAVGGMIGTWVLALIVLGIATAAAAGATRQLLKTNDPKLLIAWAFPAFGVWLVVMAIRSTLRAAHFGKSILVLQTVPASPGGALAGTVHISKPLGATGPIRLHLICAQTVRSGKNSTTVTVWEDEQQLDRLPAAKDGSDIPVYFALPRDVPVTNDRGYARIAWRLEVKAPAEEVSYWSKFTVPVFDVGSAVPLSSIASVAAADGSKPPSPLPADLAAEFRHHEAAPKPSDMAGITVSRLPDGGCVMQFAAARNWGLASMLILFGAVLEGALVVMVRSGVSLMPEIMVGFFAVIMDISALNSWFSSATVMRHRTLQIERGLPLLRRHRQISAEEIEDVAIRVSTQSGNTSYYEIVAKLGVRDIYIVGGVRGKVNAEYLAGEMKRALGLSAEVAAA